MIELNEIRERLGAPISKEDSPRIVEAEEKIEQLQTHKKWLEFEKKTVEKIDILFENKGGYDSSLTYYPDF